MLTKRNFGKKIKFNNLLNFNTMNAKRRKEVEAIMNSLDELRERIECVQSEEEEAYDNMPEGLQESERGEQMQEYISNLEDAASSVQDAVDYLNEIFG